MYQVMCLKNEFWYLCDSETMTPPLLALRYCESLVHKKAYNTQRAELQAISYFYQFWYGKFGETLDYILYKSRFTKIELIINELDSFWEYLTVGRTLKVKVLFANTNFKVNLSTCATRCIAVIRFINFLIDTYIDSRYLDRPKYEILQIRTLLKLKLQSPSVSFNKYVKNSASRENYYRSLTSYQCNDFIKIIRPSIIKNPNPLNPYANQSIQLRNYLIWLLMLRYGLRVGEVLLLQKTSFTQYITDQDKVLMHIQNLNDENDTRSQKPQIKTAESNRSINVSKSHYNMIIGIYYNKLRPAEKLCRHNFIFTSTTKPYAPLSYRTVLKEFDKSAKAFNEHFPEHYDVRYSCALASNLSPHWLRHTWAYSTLASLYKLTEDKMIKTQVVNISGVMEDAIGKLRTLGGWSLSSKMPQYYAARFMEENANLDLLNIFCSNLDESYCDTDFNSNELK